MVTLLADLDDVLALLVEARDIIEERPAAATPDWITRRGWREFLESISNEALDAAERDPAGWLAVHAEGDLRALGSAAAALTRRYEDDSAAPAPQRHRHVKHRKRQQIEALCELATARFPDAQRVVDLGSGHGHLTRALTRALPVEDSLGVDSSAERIAKALELGGRFVHGDAAEERVEAGDLVVGLHPCGALGDALVQRARDAGAHVLMVSCCFQKTETPGRRGISRRARGWLVPRASLGLANLAPRSFEGSGTLESKRAGRRTRLALRHLLMARGVALDPGDEARGVTKERIARGLRHAASHAFERRGLDPPSETELELARTDSDATYARLSRHALPRHALARVLELGIVLDRACHLLEGGWDVDVRPLFSSRVSPRNLGIVARAAQRTDGK